MIARAILALALLLAPTRVDAQLVAQVFVTPPKIDNKPVDVQIGFYLEEVLRIDEGANTFDVKGYLSLVWTDPRLKFSATDEGLPAKIYLEEDARLLLEKIWWPDIEFVNETRKREVNNEEVIVSADGRVEYKERFATTLATRYDMWAFPFDSQKLVMDIESFAWSSDDLTFRVQDNIVGFSTEFFLPGWDVLDVRETIRSHQEPRDRAPFSELEAVITIRRDPGFFLWKFLFPLTVVMLLVTGVLWMPPDLIKDRVGATLTGILTSAAYGFTIGRYMPEHVYATYLDSLVLFALIYSSALMIVNVVVFQLTLRQRTPLALQIDWHCRWLFPLVFVLGATLLAVWHLWF
jgi:hypothetical protein